MEKNMSLETITAGRITYYPSTKNKLTGFYEGTIRDGYKIKVRLVSNLKVSGTEVEDFLKLNSHPNVQRIFGYCFENSIHHFGLQNFDITLKEFIINLKNKKTDRILIIRDITEGLKFLHHNKIVHGNISFNNIGIDNKTKRAMLCNCGLDDLQEQIFQATEQFYCDSSSVKADIFSLGIIIYYILSCGSHPFGSFENKNEIKANITSSKLKIGFENLKSFSKLITGKFCYKGECALSLLREIFKKDAEFRPFCDEILKHPLFWSPFEIYNFFKRVAKKWSNLTTDDIAMVNRKSKKYFKLRSWGDQLQKIIKNENFTIEEKKDFIFLVKFIGSKIKHFEEDLNINDFTEENILFYLDEFPFLLKFVYNVNKRIKIAEEEQTTEVQFYEESNAPSSSGRTNENKTLFELCVKYGIPTTNDILISKSEIQCNEQITKSKNKAISEIFDGIYKRMSVAIKKVSKLEKPETVANEIQSFVKLRNSVMLCHSCKKKICENIIEFKGCYEEQDYYCFVLEKAEMDFEDLLFDLKNENKKNENKKATNDARIKRILYHAIKGLECLHANSIFHLDIKPKNILIVKRGEREIGCLTDFGSSKCGESVRPFTRRFDVTEDYVAPELKIKFKGKAKEQKIDYKKCDIFSYGIVFKKDFLGYVLDTETILTRNDLAKYRINEKISLLIEEFAIFTTIVDPKKRPYAEAVRKNPFFWNIEKFFKFLRDVHHFTIERDVINKEVIKTIENQAVILYNIKNDKNAEHRYSWLDRLAIDEKIYNEIKAFIEKEDEKEEKIIRKPKTRKSKPDQKQNEEKQIKKEESVFYLLKVIILIFDQPNSDEFKETREKLDISNTKDYLNFWLKKFELIAFLHNKMQKYMENEYEEYFSIQSAKRNLGNRRFLSYSIDLPDFKRSFSEVSISTENNQNKNKRSRN